MKLDTEEQIKNTLTFIKVLGNEVVQHKLVTNDESQMKSLFKILENMVSSAKSSEDMKKFVEAFYHTVLAKECAKGIKEALKSGAKDFAQHFKTEEAAVALLNPFIYAEMLKLILEHSPETIYEGGSESFKKMLTVVLLYPCVFRTSVDLQKKMYGVFLKLMTDVSLRTDKIPLERIEELLSIKLLMKMVEKLNYEFSGTNLIQIKASDEQKLMLEIIFQAESIQRKVHDRGVEHIYPTEKKILELGNCKEIMLQSNKFDLVSYLIYLKELDDSQMYTTVSAETQHNHFDMPVSARLSYDGFKSMKIRLSASTEIEPFSSVAISSDARGKNMLANKFKKDLEEQVEIHSNTVYVHYPFRQPKVVAFGEKEKNKLGMPGSGFTEEPEILPDFFENL